jgi:hypothetical protein
MDREKKKDYNFLRYLEPKFYEIKIVILTVTAIYLQESKVHHQAISQMPQHLRSFDKLHHSPLLSTN